MQNKNTVPEGLIVYASKYGTTQRYANWLQQELELPCLLPEDVSAGQLDNAAFLVIGSPVYEGRLRIKSWLKKHVKKLQGKKIFFFIVNTTGEDEQQKRDLLLLNNIPAEIKPGSELFFVPGRIIREKLNFFDRLMIKMAERMAKKEGKQLPATVEIRKENVASVIKAVVNYCYGKFTQTTTVFAQKTNETTH